MGGVMAKAAPCDTGAPPMRLAGSAADAVECEVGSAPPWSSLPLLRALANGSSTAQ